MKILLTGGSGTLGSELLRIYDKSEHKIFAPSSEELDIRNLEQIKEKIYQTEPEVIVHSAAYTDVKKAENDLSEIIDINVIGTCNIIKACQECDKKLVFISTDHVFDGEKGYYKTTDLINPITVYAKSKASAEIAVRMYKKSLVIRTSFFKHNFPYEKAFIDQWSSKDYVDIMAPKILKGILSNKLGIMHCFSERKSIYEIAKQRNPNVKKITRRDIDFPTLKDTSLI